MYMHYMDKINKHMFIYSNTNVNAISKAILKNFVFIFVATNLKRDVPKLHYVNVIYILYGHIYIYIYI